MKSILAAILSVSALLCCAAGVPEPQPVKSAVEISAIYYPGTDRMAEWDMIDQTMPHIKPLLGWYDEGCPEVIDWQIKWAVEHGISSFCVDWYWCRGVQRFNHWVTGYYKARHRRYLKWYMNWCNHNDPGAHSTSDQVAVTKWWIDNFFKTPEYYKDETGRPLVVLYEWRNLDRDFIDEAAKRGEKMEEGDGLKRAIDLSTRLAREAGLPGIRFAAFVHDGRPDEKTEALLRKAGIEEFFQYVFAWPQTVRCSLPPARRAMFTAKGVPFSYTYDFVRDASPGWWAKNWNADGIPYWPALSTGWNSTPRQFQLASKVTNRTVEDFAAICQAARAFCESNGVRRVVLGPLNEWQEGSYIEPNAEYGFGMYDALRDAFCEKPAQGWPKNLVPSDVGLGPYDYPPLDRPARTAWDFDGGGDPQGWYRNPYGAQTIRAHDGVLEFFRTFAGRSRAAIRSRPAPFAAEKFTSLEIRMRLRAANGNDHSPKGDEQVRIFWGTPELPIFDKSNAIQDRSSAAVPAKVDGEWHVYRIPVAENPLWKGMVEELWFDPSDLEHVTAQIDWMRFVKCTPSAEASRAENFANPPSRMRILPLKHIRGKTEKGIARELDSLQNQGFGGMAFNARWDENYMCSDEDLALFAKSARAAHARGMTLWLYDEHSYPSGTAAGLVLKGHPEWQARGALVAYADAKAGEEVCVEAPPGNHLLSVALPLCDGRVAADSEVRLPAPVDGKLVWRAPDGGGWRVCVVTEDAVYKGTHVSIAYGLKVPYINLLQPEPVRRFIEVTHDRYAALFDRKEFSEIFTSTFTDEPSLMQWMRPMPYLNLPWCGELPGDYRERTGRDLVADIPRIAFNTTDENDRRWRGAYWRMLGERVKRNYTGQLRTWCEGHGIRSGGHLLDEESLDRVTGLYGDFFGVLRGFTAPGVDCLVAYPGKISPLTPLYASSAAALNDVPVVMCEYTSYGATPEKHPSKEESLGCAFKLIAGGITQMPSYHRFHAFKTNAEKKTFNECVGRAMAVVDGTFSAAGIALYYPTETLQSIYEPGFSGGCGRENVLASNNFKLTGDALYEASRSFLVIDSEAVRAARVEGGELVHGKLRWRVVVLPWASVLPPDVAEKLDSFRRAGGAVLATGKRPECSPESFPDGKVKAFGATLELVDCASLGRILRKIVPPALDVGGEPTPVRILCRRDDRGQVFFLYNDSPEAWRGRVTVASRPGHMELWRPIEGDHRSCALDDGSLEIEIKGYGAVGLTEAGK